ncbi:class II aldolase/adducin family protein [Streptomyces montanisoli]|uniref:Class II aldolase/adducin family protein n=1 Tax=Streptomyces montanisoli TaxID=2798581 RepID=A0A940MBB8_9ACTN|nr:class II aldolase/adducin family protein [Streptomyces montanisoli]MBP0456890.1 class II aldolase/adducin family protein [Streptomyces montanisoli]
MTAAAPGPGTDPADAAAALSAAGRRLAALGLSPGSSGNLSVRTATGFLATPTGTPLAALTPEGLSVLGADGRPSSGPPPTKEVPLHLAVYARLPHVRAVVHLHSRHAVAVACLDPRDPADALPPLTPYAVLRLGRVPLLPYAPPGSARLAEGAAGLPPGARAFLLAHHGQVATGTRLDEAVDAAVELEESAALQLLVGERRPARPLTVEQCAELTTDMG